MTSQARWTALTSRVVGRESAGKLSRPSITVLVPSAGSDRIDARPGIGMPPVTVPSRLRWPKQRLGHVAVGLGHQLDGRELDRVVVVDPAGQRVADAHLDRRGDRRHRERDEEPEPVIAVAAPPQHADGVHGGDQEAADEVGGDEHVGRLVRHGLVEDHRRWDRRSPPCRTSRAVKPAGEFIQALAATTDTRPADAGDHDRDAGPEVRPRLQPAPAVDVDGDEDRLGEEEQALDGEGDRRRRRRSGP